MEELDNLHALVNIGDIKELKRENERKDEIIDFHQEVFKNIELFLTFWYRQTTEFGKIKDDFNEQEQFDCELVVDNNRVKLKMNKKDNEENNS